MTKNLPLYIHSMIVKAVEATKNILTLPVSLPNGKEGLLDTLLSEFKKESEKIKNKLWNEAIEKF